MNTKKCSRCGIIKPITEYFNHSKNGVILPHTECKQCTLATNKHQRKVNTVANTNERISRLESSNLLKKCACCHLLKPITQFNIRRSAKDAHDIYCKECSSIKKKVKHHSHKLLPKEQYEQWRLGENTKRKLEKIQMKIDVFTHYSKDGILRCANPYGLHKENITDLDILTLDHINGDGKYDKDKTGRRIGGILIYRRCKRLNYPQGFQVLCANCQAKKAVLNNERYTNRWNNKNATKP